MRGRILGIAKHVENMVERVFWRERNLANSQSAQFFRAGLCVEKRHVSQRWCRASEKHATESAKFATVVSNRVVGS